MGKFLSCKFVVSWEKKSITGGSAAWELKKIEEELEKVKWGPTSLPNGARHILPVRKCTMVETDSVMSGEPEEVGSDLEVPGKSGRWTAAWVMVPDWELLQRASRSEERLAFPTLNPVCGLF